MYKSAYNIKLSFPLSSSVYFAVMRKASCFMRHHTENIWKRCRHPHFVFIKLYHLYNKRNLWVLKLLTHQSQNICLLYLRTHHYPNLQLKQLSLICGDNPSTKREYLWKIIAGMCFFTFICCRATAGTTSM